MQTINRYINYLTDKEMICVEQTQDIMSGGVMLSGSCRSIQETHKGGLIEALHNTTIFCGFL